MPSPSEIRAARLRAGLTQAAAAALVGVQPRAWRYWEGGGRKMDPAAWRLFGAVHLLLDVEALLQAMFLRNKLDESGIEVKKNVDEFIEKMSVISGL